MKKRTMPLLGVDAEVTEMEILEKKDRSAEYTLEDNSIIRVNYVPTAVLRLEGQYNADGTPIYLVTNGVVVNVIYSPDEVKKKP